MKTPSPKYIASKHLLGLLKSPNLPEPAVLTELFGSRISEEKRDKVQEQITKIAAKFRERLEKTVEKVDKPKKAPKVTQADGKKKKKDKNKSRD